jgi:hypothetical protein
VQIIKSNCVEWATIKEENEKTPLMERLARNFHGSLSAPPSESSGESDISKESFAESVKGGKNTFIIQFNFKKIYCYV